MQTAYQLISVVGGVVTPLTLSDDLDALAASRDVMNVQAAPGVRYMVRLVLIDTRPLVVLEDDATTIG